MSGESTRTVGRGLPAGLARERQPQLGVTLEPGRPAEPHDGGHRGCAVLREPPDRQFRGAGRVAQHRIGDAALRRAKRRRDGADPHEDAHDRSIHGCETLLHPDRQVRKLLTRARSL
jgi:hypothetical protein